MITPPPIRTPFFKPDGATIETPWVEWLRSLAKPTVTAHTLTLGKLTEGGTAGSISWDAHGRITAYVDPT